MVLLHYNIVVAVYTPTHYPAVEGSIVQVIEEAAYDSHTLYI